MPRPFICAAIIACVSTSALAAKPVTPLILSCLDEKKGPDNDGLGPIVVEVYDDGKVTMVGQQVESVIVTPSTIKFTWTISGTKMSNTYTISRVTGVMYIGMWDGIKYSSNELLCQPVQPKF